MSVDISDLSAPVLLDQAIVRGYIQTSRLTQGCGKAELYVAADNDVSVTTEHEETEGGSADRRKTINLLAS